MMIKCSKCGFENQMGAIFCRQCGEKIDMNALSPEALEESRGKEERKKKVAGLIRNLVGIVLLLAIVGIGAGLFVPWGHPAYQAPEEDKEMETKLDLKMNLLASETVFRLPEKEKFSMAELNHLFEKRFFDGTSESGSAYAIEHISFSVENDQLAVLIYTRLAGRLPVIFRVVGMPEIGDAAAPVQFRISKVKMGHIPVSFLGKRIVGKFDSLLKNPEMKRIFERSNKIEMDDGALEFHFKKVSEVKAAEKAMEKAAEKNAEKAVAPVVKKKKKTDADAKKEPAGKK